jgi:uncharacterized membrane protein YsdA (DUF1294 family)/cold shock CspA family protein
MRFEGKIINWDDARGVGFVSPSHGSDIVFLDVRAFTPGQPRPLGSENVTYELMFDDQRKSHAVDVRYASPNEWHASRIKISILVVDVGAALLFLTGLLAATAKGMIPLWLPMLYVFTSAVTMLTYRLDKLKAKRGDRRIPENTLHLLGLIGGWPGALLAQQVFRHKNRKVSFQIFFLMTVVINICCLIGVLYFGLDRLSSFETILFR